MIEIKNVQGTMKIVREVEFNVDTVYVRTNIVRVETEDFVGWQYDEVQYDYKEWIELNSNKINILKEENEKQDELIDTTLLATDEMYMMLEPLLASQVNLTSEYISRMAAMYVAMVQRGLKTIDEVPVRYREEVRAIIEN